MTDRNSPEPTGRDPGSKPGFGSDGVAWPQLSGLSNDLYLHPTVRTLRDGSRIPGGREGGRQSRERTAKEMGVAEGGCAPVGPRLPADLGDGPQAKRPRTCSCRPAWAVGEAPGPPARPRSLLSVGGGSNLLCYPPWLVLRKLHQFVGCKPLPTFRLQRSVCPPASGFLLSDCWGHHHLSPVLSRWQPSTLCAS